MTVGSYLCKVTTNEMHIMTLHGNMRLFMGKRKHLIGTAHLFDTCLFTLSEGAQLPVEEDETFGEVTCLLPRHWRSRLL